MVNLVSFIVYPDNLAKYPDFHNQFTTKGLFVTLTVWIKHMSSLYLKYPHKCKYIAIYIILHNLDKSVNIMIIHAL